MQAIVKCLQSSHYSFEKKGKNTAISISIAYTYLDVPFLQAMALLKTTTMITVVTNTTIKVAKESDNKTMFWIMLIKLLLKSVSER